MSTPPRARRALLPFLLLFFSFALGALAPAARAQSGSARLEGAITDAATGTPLPGASVAVLALERGTSAGPDGTYRLANLPAGALDVRVSFVGYEAQTRTVRLHEGQATTLDVSLSSTAVQGEEVVVTGTPVAQTTLRVLEEAEQAANTEHVAAPQARKQP